MKKVMSNELVIMDLVKGMYTLIISSGQKTTKVRLVVD